MNKGSSYLSKFSKVTIKIASPEAVLQRSYGEIVNPKTIMYKTYRPEMGGLFCERIFGPVKDFTCSCGKYKGYEYYGIICDICGTEIIEKRVRREREGHIELAVPMVNPCFLKENPNRIAILLGLDYSNLKKVAYYEKYIVINPGIFAKKGIKKNDLLTIEQYCHYTSLLPTNHPSDYFIAKTGGEAILQLIKDIDIKALYFSLQKKLKDNKNNPNPDDIRRMGIVRDFYSETGGDINKPEWMIIRLLSVIPADLRPTVVVNRVVMSVDINELYRKIIIRNNRLKKMLDINAPEVLLRHEKRMLQEAINDLIIGPASTNGETASNYKSLLDLIKGKEGRFRQNLLGKRVDYSGRSVIVVNPLLKTYECGLPKDMVIEIFKPFIINKLFERGILNIIEAENIIKAKDKIVYEIVEQLLPGFPVMLNRAPTLHKMSIQSFQPKLVEGNAIQLSPLVCSQFNADFDGDQMAVHVPLSIRAREEAFMLTMSSNNLFKSSDGSSSFVPNMEMILGLYFLTFSFDKENTKEMFVFSSVDEITLALDEKKISVHDNIRVVLNTTKINKNDCHIIDTTVGRCLFNDCFPDDYVFIDKLITSAEIKSIISDIEYKYATDVVSIIIDKIKDLGFKWAYKSGLSFKINDLKVPDEKQEIIREAEKEAAQIEENYEVGFIDKKECINQIISLWMRTVNVKMMRAITKLLCNKVDNGQFNSVEAMLKSGARGSIGQLLQTCGMKGLISASSSSILSIPIISNFMVGLTVLEYFLSTYGGRKGLVDTALKTAEAGYLTRKLVDVAQNIIVCKHNCGTKRYIKISKIGNNNKILDDNEFKKRLIGRTCAKDVYSLLSNNIVIHADEMLDDNIIDTIIKEGIDSVCVRSVLTCESKIGVCALCYGKSLEFNSLAQEGEPVGIIAAQSIGQPGTQLTLNTFHVGGVASSTVFESNIKANYDGYISISNLQTIDKNGKKIVTSTFCEVKIFQNITDILQEIFNVPYGATLYVTDKQNVQKGDILYKIDPYVSTIIAVKEGTIEYKNFEGNIIVNAEHNSFTNETEYIVNKIINNNTAVLILHTKDRDYKYGIYAKMRILVENGQKVKVGDSLIKKLRKLVMSSDITGGLPRASALLEAKNDANPAILSDIDGAVKIGNIVKKNLEVLVESSNSKMSYKYMIPVDKDILVQEGDFIKHGTPLCSGDINAAEIFKTKGFFAVCMFLLSEIKSVYQLQGISIPDKHIEVIIKQMMSFVQVVDPGDSSFISGEIVSRYKFVANNERLVNQLVITDNGDSTKYSVGEYISTVELDYENFLLSEEGKKTIVTTECKPAKAKVVLMGISNASLKSSSFLAAASFQFTSDVLIKSAVKVETDYLTGIKENVIVGHKIPVGTGYKRR